MGRVRGLWERAMPLTRLAAMPGHKRLAATLAVAGAAVAFSACGSSDADRTISPTDADTLQAALAQVQAAVDQGKCSQAQEHADAFVDAVNELPETVGTENKEALRTAGENLQELASDPDQCDQTGTTGLTDTQPTTPEETTTTPPESTTTTDETTTRETTTTTTKPRPDTGNEGNGGGGSGGGQPGGGPPPGGGGGGGSGSGGGTGGTGSGGTGTGGTGGGTG
jgi:hypothetical protein